MKSTLLLFGTISIAILAGCRARDSEPSRSHAEDPPVPVSVFTARSTEEVASARLVALAEPSRRTAVGTRLMARVIDVRAAEGSRVTTGTILVRLDARDLAARENQIAANAAAASAQAGLASSESGRVKRLAAEGAVPSAQVESAETSAKASGAAVDGAQAALVELGIQLGESVIRAPFDALVVQKRTEIGSFASPGEPLLVLEDDSSLRVVARVADREAAATRIGASYGVEFATGELATGLLESLNPSGDPHSPGLIAVFRVANDQHRVRSGVVAYVSVPAGAAQRASVMRVPSRAIVRRGGLAGAFVVRNETLSLVWCAIDDSPHEGTIRILDGLADGDVVVVDASSSALADGRRVAVQP